MPWLASIIAADTRREARRLATTQQMPFVNLIRGTAGLSPPPMDHIVSCWSSAEKRHVMQMLSRSIVGTVMTCANKRKRCAQTQAPTHS